MEKDLVSAEKSAKKEQKQLVRTAAEKKADELEALDQGSSVGGSSDELDDEDFEVDDGDGARNITAQLTKRSPEQIFKQFDTDNSGLINFDEFRTMLPQLGIRISMPKVEADKTDRLVVHDPSSFVESCRVSSIGRDGHLLCAFSTAHVSFSGCVDHFLWDQNAFLARHALFTFLQHFLLGKTL